MKIKVSEATGPVLDWMVAKAEGALAPVGNLYFVGRQLFVAVGGDLGPLGEWVLYTPSTDWAQGGPITEREGIEIKKGNPLIFPKGNEKGEYSEPLWIAGKMHGRTMLEAAMRCYVASKLGDEVEVPSGLIS